MPTYAVPGETLTGIANAIRSKTGSDEQMPVSAMAAAIESISGGGSAQIETGTFVIDNAVTISTAGLILPVTLPFKPDFFKFWYDADDFSSRDDYPTHRFYMFTASKIPNNVPLLRPSAGLTLQHDRTDENGYVFSYWSSASQVGGTSSPDDYAIGSATSSTIININSYPSFKVNDNGTIMIGRYSSATTYLLAGRYHFVAIKGVDIYAL